MVLSNYDMSRKKLTFIKNKELHTFNNIWNDLLKMNEIINKLSLSEEKIMPELHLKSQDLLITLVDYLLNIAKEFRSLEKQVIENIYTEMN